MPDSFVETENVEDQDFTIKAIDDKVIAKQDAISNGGWCKPKIWGI